jgi:DNA-binding beta-propeller fold protein YncE
MLLTVLVAGCASPTSSNKPENSAASIVWPQPPATARIRYLYSFSEPLDLEIKPSWGRQFMNALAGEKKTGMVRPYAVAVQGRKILVADPGAKAVHLFDLERRKHLAIFSAGDQPLASPVGVALSESRVYVADSALGQLFLFDHKGNLLKFVADLQRPTGLAFDHSADRLYVAETLAHRVAVFDSDGNRLFDFGARGTKGGEFNFPSHLSISAEKLLVNDNMNFQIKTFSLDGRELTVFGKHGDSSGQFSQPKGVAADSEGNVYVAGATIDRIQIFSAQGEFLLAFGGEGNAPGKFLMPAGITIDNDRIYVADSYNGRVQVFQFLGGDQ